MINLSGDWQHSNGLLFRSLLDIYNQVGHVVGRDWIKLIPSDPYRVVVKRFRLAVDPDVDDDWRINTYIAQGADHHSRSGFWISGQAAACRE